MNRIFAIAILCFSLCSTLWAADQPCLYTSANKDQIESGFAYCKDGEIIYTESVQLARMNPYIAGAVSSAAACSTSSDTAIWDHSGDASEAGVDQNYRASKIVLAGSTDVTEYKIKIQTDSGPQNWTASLYTNNVAACGGADCPNTEIAGTSKTVADSTAAWHVLTLTLDAVKTGVTGTVWLVVHNPNATTSRIARPDGGASDFICYGADAASWTCGDYYLHAYTLMGCQ